MLAQLGPYLIDEELAEGGMARVFRARLRGLGGFEKQLVLKQIRPELAKDPRFVELFVREANTLVALSHPHIVQVYELGAAEGTYYLSMEYVEGATVARILEDGPLPPALAAHLCAQVCEALSFAHDRFGILHRDVTPRNIIVDRAGHSRLLDFGIATSVHQGESELFGSPGYMSPEQARGEPLTAASDLFSLGCVLYEALAGRPALAKTPQASLSPAAALDETGALPAALTQLVARLLAPEPSARPSAVEAARVLRGYLAQTHPEGVLEDMQRRCAQAQHKQAEPTAPDAGSQTAPVFEGTAKIEAKSIATSPVLTEILRSAPGVAMPSPEQGHTRRIRERSLPPEPAAGPRLESAQATRFMLKAWPLLAGLSMLAALALAARGTPPTRVLDPSAQTTSARPPQAAPKTATPEPVSIPSVPAAPVPAPAPVSPNALADAATAEDAATGPQDKEDTARPTLSINAVPWAEVSVDGRVQGTTPLRKLKLRPGPHRLAFQCPPLGKSKELSVELPRQGDARIVVDLGQDPPRTFLDGAKEVR